MAVAYSSSHTIGTVRWIAVWSMLALAASCMVDLRSFQGNAPDMEETSSSRAGYRGVPPVAALQFEPNADAQAVKVSLSQGVPLSRDWILTHGHGLGRYLDGQGKVDPKFLAKVADPEQQGVSPDPFVANIAEIHVHPKWKDLEGMTKAERLLYSKHAVDHDLALVRLQTPFDWGSYAKLPEKRITRADRPVDDNLEYARTGNVGDSLFRGVASSARERLGSSRRWFKRKNAEPDTIPYETEFIMAQRNGRDGELGFIQDLVQGIENDNVPQIVVPNVGRLNRSTGEERFIDARGLSGSPLYMAMRDPEYGYTHRHGELVGIFSAFSPSGLFKTRGDGFYTRLDTSENRDWIRDIAGL